MNYDVIIPVSERNILIIDIVISYLIKNIAPQNIFLIGNRKLKEKISVFDCAFIDENELYGELTYDAIKKLIVERDSFAGWRTGWYLQQFLKMSYAYVCSDEYYLVWDADTIPLKKIQMFDDNSNPYFDIRDEYNRSYFTTIKKLFNGKVKKENPYSYISEYMLIKTNYMRNLITTVEDNQMLKGKYYYEKIMNTICEVDLMHSGFSEFETYGNYVNTYYPEKYSLRKLTALRYGDRYLHYPPTDLEIRWAAQSYDIITMENRQQIYSDINDNLDDLIKNYSLKEVVKKYENGMK